MSAIGQSGHRGLCAARRLRAISGLSRVVHRGLCLRIGRLTISVSRVRRASLYLDEINEVVPVTGAIARTKQGLERAVEVSYLVGLLQGEVLLRLLAKHGR